RRFGARSAVCEHERGRDAGPETNQGRSKHGALSVAGTRAGSPPTARIVRSVTSKSASIRARIDTERPPTFECSTLGARIGRSHPRGESEPESRVELPAFGADRVTSFASRLAFRVVGRGPFSRALLQLGAKREAHAE